MKTPLPLPSQERLKELLDYDPLTGMFVKKSLPELTAYDRMVNVRCAGKEPGRRLPSGYHIIVVDKKSYVAHRLAWMIQYNVDPGRNTIDHINHNVSDNRIENLRLISQHTGTRKKPRSSKGQPLMGNYKGAYQTNTGKWYAKIRVNNQDHRSNLFDTEVEAAKSYNEMALRYHGGFARLNNV